MNRSIMKKAHTNIPFTIRLLQTFRANSNPNCLVLPGLKLDQNTPRCAQVRSNWDTAPPVPLRFTGSKKGKDW